MNAFIETENGLFKVYRHGLEWQVIGPRFERWFSVWQHNPMASLLRALDSVPGNRRTVEIVSLKGE
jgi:hypothetical protein